VDSADERWFADVSQAAGGKGNHRMFEFLRKVFGSSEERTGRSDSAGIMASEDLGRIERELARLGHGPDASRLLNRAGDLYLVKGDRQRALKRYGAAIDAFLQSGEYDSAMAVCRKIIRVVPEVIRTRRTLAWLCLGKGFLEIAREHIDAYASASVEAGLEPLAGQRSGDEIAQAARALWGGVHGICILALSDTLGITGVDSVQHLTRSLIGNYLKGFVSE